MSAPRTTLLQVFPDRVYDVGIAEQHAVTFAAGLACEGLAPFVAIYSSFLQRGYDQVVHDVSLQNLPGASCPVAGCPTASSKVCCMGQQLQCGLVKPSVRRAATVHGKLRVYSPWLPGLCAVRFALDRAGLVGADGATHCGAFDVTYMACLPNMVCMAPSNEAELINMVATAAAIDDR